MSSMVLDALCEPPAGLGALTFSSERMRAATPDAMPDVMTMPGVTMPGPVRLR